MLVEVTTRDITVAVVEVIGATIGGNGSGGMEVRMGVAAVVWLLWR